MFIILTPLTVVWDWSPAISTALLFAVILLLLLTGQTIIFLLRLVAADRRGRRRPLASGSKTVGEIEDASAPAVTGATDVIGATDPSDRRNGSDVRRHGPRVRRNGSPSPPADDTFPPEDPVRQ